MSSGRRVAIVGGGLAGITAALDCADAGLEVTLLEVRRRLGGAAYSFERDGMMMDNGQHVFLRCCTAYRALLERLGSLGQLHIQERLDIPVLAPRAPAARLRRSRLPAPLHLAAALARYPHLSPRERLRAALAALALGRLDPADERLDAETLGAFLERHSQGPRAVAALWDLVALPTLNVGAARASLALGAFVFQTGLLSSADAGDIGFHRGTLDETIGEPAARALSAAGVDVRLGWGAERLAGGAGAFELGGRAGEEAVHADAVIVALPHTRAGSLIEALLPESARALEAMSSSPIVNLHIVYDREVCEEPFAAGVGTPVQYIFDRTEAAGAPAGSQYLAVSLSGAEREMAMRDDALRAAYLPAIEELLPRARGAQVLRFVATREHAATFSAVPGVGALRPPSRARVRGLALAGAYTDTGWPATLEGAVRSGHAAARAVLDALEHGGHAPAYELAGTELAP
jgi:squalene-associated FAD-dependent desaturase